MEIEQPLPVHGTGCPQHSVRRDHITCFEEGTARDDSAEITTLDGYPFPDSDTCTVTIAESFSCGSPQKVRETYVSDWTIKREQSTTDSLDTPLKVEESERLQEPDVASVRFDVPIASQPSNAQINLPMAQGENAFADSMEASLLASPLHMYSRRKKGKILALSSGEKNFNDAWSVFRDQSAQVNDEFKRHSCSPCAVQSNVLEEKPKVRLSKGRPKLTTILDDEGLQQQKQTKCALSPKKKQGQDVDANCKRRDLSTPRIEGSVSVKRTEYAAVRAGLQSQTTTFVEKARLKDEQKQKKRGRDVSSVDAKCKRCDLFTPRIGGSVSIKRSEYAAVRSGLQAQTPSLIEKARFKDEMKQKHGLQLYLECRNFILGLWERDVSQTLSITDCLGTVAALNESFQTRFLCDVYDFLNYHGFINAGVAAKKPRLSSEAQSGGEFADCHKARFSEGFAKVDDKSVGEGSEEKIRSRVSLTSVAAGRRKEASTDLEQAIVGYERKKKSRHGVVLHENSEGTMVIEKHFEVKEFQNKLAELSFSDNSVCSGGEAGSESIRVKPSDEELLLDMKNRIKARNKLKKQSMHRETSTPVNSKGQEQSKVVLMTECEDYEVQIKANKSSSPIVDGYSFGDQERATICTYEKQPLTKKVIVVGAGPAGLVAARHLQNMDLQVIILEARDRVGGRIFTDSASFSGPVDLGANVVTGTEPDMASGRRPDPAALLCKQLNLELTILQGECPLFDVANGLKVHPGTDKALEADFNSLLDETVKYVVQNRLSSVQMSLQEGLKLAFRKYKALAKHDPSEKSKLECSGQANTLCAASMLFSKENVDYLLAQRIMSWHFASLEHRCGAELSKVSLPFWNQDDSYGGFAGPHCMIRGGFSTVMEALGADLEIHLEQIVTKIDYTCRDDGNGGGEIQVLTKGGATFKADAVLLTVPLGCMKSNMIKFFPPLPDWKGASIQRLGFGLLNKVVMEFPLSFWDETVYSFGCTAELSETRGHCYLFLNLKTITGFPILCSLTVGKAAVEDEQKEDSEVLEHALLALRKLFGKSAVPQPTAFRVTRWGSDPYSRGAYSYVAVGASDCDHDTLGHPVDNRIFFAGEATCKEHPGTVGGAMMSGLREAVRILNVLYNRVDLQLEAEAMGAAEKQSDTEGNEVKEVSKRLFNGAKMAGGKLGRPLSKASLLQGLFGVLKTNSGRVLLAREMLQLSRSSLKGLLNTKAALRVLNSWIQGSIGKDGGQLLRLSLQMLLVVESPLSLVRRSGVESTVKEEVLRHSKRDIRATACQLLKLWLETPGKIKDTQDLSKPSKKSAKFHNLIQKRKGKDLKVVSSLAGAVLKSNRASSQASRVLRKNSGKNILQGKTARPTRALEPILVDNVALDVVKVKSIPDPEKCSQALEVSTSAVGAEPAIFTPARAELPVSKDTEMAGAKALELVEAAKSKQPELPKILSFQKFAKRDQIDSTKRRPLLRETLILYGKDLVTSGADARQSKVRDWSIDFSDSSTYLGSPRLLAMLDNASSKDCLSAVAPDMPGISSTEIAGERHESGLTSNQDEEGSPNSKEVSDDDLSASFSLGGSQRRQLGICLASLNSGNMPCNAPLIEDGKPVSDHRQCSNVPNLKASISNDACVDAERQVSHSLSAEKRPESAEGHSCSFIEANDASAGSSVRFAAEQRAENQKTIEMLSSHLPDGEKNDNSMGAVSTPAAFQGCNSSLDTTEQVKKVVTEYVAQLLTPLYKTRRIDKESFKSIMKKAIAKVMERRTDEELLMEASEFMDTKRKIKIRSLIDKLVERHLENVDDH